MEQVTAATALELLREVDRTSPHDVGICPNSVRVIAVDTTMRITCIGPNFTKEFLKSRRSVEQVLPWIT